MISCQLINFLHIVYLKNYLLILFYIFFFFVLCYYFYMYFFFFFFFSSRRRHTRLTCDWSSDVFSSDLKQQARRHPEELFHFGRSRTLTKWLSSSGWRRACCFSSRFASCPASSPPTRRRSCWVGRRT